MQKPTPRETLPRLQELGILTASECAKYLASYEHFESRRAEIEKNYLGKWVASIADTDNIIIADSLPELRVFLALEDSHIARFAYIEQMI